MVQVNTQIEGLRELKAKSDRLKKSMPTTVLRPALRAVGSLVGRGARKRIENVDSGDLRRRGINWRVRRPKRTGEMNVDVGWTRDQFYGSFLELGTSQQQARPHLRPELADRHSDGSLNDKFIEFLNKSIARVTERAG